MKIDMEKSLAELDKNLTPNNSQASGVIKKHNSLLTKKLCCYTTEDLRFMIGQRSGLKYLVPIALNTLRDNIFTEGDFYEGDLLYNVLNIDKEFWRKNRDLAGDLSEMIKEGLDFGNVFVTDEIKNDLLTAVNYFKQVAFE